MGAPKNVSASYLLESISTATAGNYFYTTDGFRYAVQTEKDGYLWASIVETSTQPFVTIGTVKDGVYAVGSSACRAAQVFCRLLALFVALFEKGRIEEHVL